MLDRNFSATRFSLLALAHWLMRLCALVAILAPITGSTEEDYLSRALPSLAHAESVKVPSPFHDASKTDVMRYILRHSKHEYIRAERYATAILTAAEKHRVPSSLISAVIFTESSFQHAIVSRRNAVGLAQIRPKFWLEKCPEMDAAKGNITCGAMILREYRDRCGNWSCSLAWYNGGPRAYRKRPAVKKEADAYAARVLARAGTVTQFSIAEN